jgi:transcriptional regulator with XRE-family HTH domain
MNLAWGIGRVVQHERGLRNMSRAELARQAGVTDYLVKRLEAGARVPGEVLDAVAEALGLEVAVAAIIASAPVPPEQRRPAKSADLTAPEAISGVFALAGALDVITQETDGEPAAEQLRAANLAFGMVVSWFADRVLPHVPPDDPYILRLRSISRQHLGSSALFGGV